MVILFNPKKGKQMLIHAQILARSFDDFRQGVKTLIVKERKETVITIVADINEVVIDVDSMEYSFIMLKKR